MAKIFRCYHSAANYRIDRNSCYIQIYQFKSWGDRNYAGIERTQTKVYQEALEEGRQEGIEQGKLEAKLEMAIDDTGFAEILPSL